MPLCKRDLIHQHIHLVQCIARRVWRELDGNVEVEDLEGYGMEGLLQAVKRFHRGRGASFATFAGYRIRGAMYDAVRAHGRFTRKQVAAYRAGGEQRDAGRTPEPDALPADAPAPDELASAGEEKQWLRSAVLELEREERHFIRRMYFDGKQLGEAGRELGMSKSWASRLHARALQRLRDALVSDQR